MHRKISALIAVFTVTGVLCLASCGNRETASSTSTPPSPVPATAGPTPRPPAVPVADKGAAEPKKSESADPHMVTIDNFTFSPHELTVPVNTTVTWINRDDIPHTVREKKKRFTSPTLDTDEKFSFTFTEAGTYDYFCTIHTHMTGQIIVK